MSANPKKDVRSMLPRECDSSVIFNYHCRYMHGNIAAALVLRCLLEYVSQLYETKRGRDYLTRNRMWFKCQVDVFFDTYGIERDYLLDLLLLWEALGVIAVVEKQKGSIWIHLLPEGLNAIERESRSIS